MTTWYEADGSAIIQRVDAAGAVAPVVFDPTFSTVPCNGGYRADESPYTYLDIYVYDSPNYCPPIAMIYAARGYIPEFGYETNVANDYGKIILRTSGQCSPPALPRGFAWDFEVPCYAHDYCYDLRRASFSGTVSDQECDDWFYWLMEAHCNNRVLAGDCRAVRDTYWLAVRAPLVVANPAPGLVTLRTVSTGKCADVEGPSLADSVAIQQWTCVNVNQQKWRIYPANSSPGYFEMRSAYSGKCPDVNINVSPPRRISQWPCNTTAPQRQFRIVWRGISNIFTIRSKFSNAQACWDVPNNGSTNGLDLYEWWCDDQVKQQWRIFS